MFVILSYVVWCVVLAGMANIIQEAKEAVIPGESKTSASGKRILIVATSHDKLGDSGQPTGCWAEELAAPYYIFKDAGAQVDVASIKGGKIPIDIGSLAENFVTPHVNRYLADESLKESVELAFSEGKFFQLRRHLHSRRSWYYV